MVELKIMSYNIWNGFVDKNSGEFQEDRLENAKKVVGDYSPDILVLTEGVVFDNSDKGLSLQDYAKAFGYNYAIKGLAGFKDMVRSMVVLSDYYLEGSDYSLPGFGFLRVFVSLGDEKLNLDVVHPKPQADDEEKARFLKAVLRDSQRPYILAGDFNAISSQDYYERDKLYEGFSRVEPKMATKIVDNFMKMVSINEVLKHGLKDSFKELNDSGFTMPSDLASEDKSTAIRIDYIFCSNDFEVLDSGIIRNEKTEKASDHYPVYAKLRLYNGK